MAPDGIWMSVFLSLSPTLRHVSTGFTRMKSLKGDHCFHLGKSERSKGFCCFVMQSEELITGGAPSLFCLLRTSSFSWVNPLALTQLPLCAGPSDTISICCNYRDPSPPTLSASLTHTHTEDTAHWCNSCCLGGHGRLWVGSINVMVHTHKRSHTLAQPHHRWGPPYLPSPTEGHPAANEDTQTPSTVSTTWA